MERDIGLDVHTASCTMAVISERGRRLKDFPVETNGQALVEAVRMIPGHEHLVIKARRPQTQGLSRQHDRFLKDIFKGAATTVVTQRNKDPIHARYERLLDGGTDGQRQRCDPGREGLPGSIRRSGHVRGGPPFLRGFGILPLPRASSCPCWRIRHAARGQRDP